METWEKKLNVRRKACEFRLNSYRESHARSVERRDKHEFHSVAWWEFDAIIKYTQRAIARELDEIAFVRDLQWAGPIFGGDLNLANGPTILDLFDRAIDQAAEEGNEEFRAGVAFGRDILTNPYRHLHTSEKRAFDMARDAARSTTAEQQEAQGLNKPIEKRGPGRPKKSRSVTGISAGKKMPSVKINIVGNSAQLERSEDATGN